MILEAAAAAATSAARERQAGMGVEFSDGRR